jgi:hypothetical protein
MKTRHYAGAFLALVLTAGCVTAGPKAARSEFEDIPVPKGLTLQADESTIIESPNVKAARLLYRGRIEPESLGSAMRATLETNGWRNVSATSSATKGPTTTQVYEKGGNSLQVQIWEGGLFNMFTYVELTASRAMVGAPAAATTVPVPATSTR